MTGVSVCFSSVQGSLSALYLVCVVVGKGAAGVISWVNPATFGLVRQMFQSYSHTQVWRKKRTTTTRMNTTMAPALKNRQIRTGFSQAHAHQTPMPRTTAASCSLYWWPLVSLFLPSSASAGCESKAPQSISRGAGREGVGPNTVAFNFSILFII